MKIFIGLLLLVFTFTVGAQEQSNNEGVIAYSFVRSNVKASTPSFKFDKDTDAHGINLGYTRYFAGTGRANTVGVTADLGVNFKGKNEASLVTLMGGLTAKARNAKYVQPYVRVLAGVARQNVRVSNISDVSDVAPSFALGGGLDFRRFRLGADYVNTGFNGDRQNNARLIAGFVF